MTHERRKVAVTGANGFLGSNLVIRLREEGHDVASIARDTDPDEAAAALADSDFVFHLAGANRPSDDGEFLGSNRDYTAWVAGAIAAGGRKPLLVYSSSAKATEESAYGRANAPGNKSFSTWQRPVRRPCRSGGSRTFAASGPSQLQFGCRDLLPQCGAWDRRFRSTTRKHRSRCCTSTI